LERIFGRLGTRSLTDRRESWESYLAFVRTKVDVPALLRERGEGVAVDEGTRGPGGGGESAAEIFGRRLPEKTVVLTFDDGPHARHTDRIREILAQHQARAVFFHVGQNLGALGKDDTVQRTRAAAASQRLLEAGHTLANHSFTHSFLPKLDDGKLQAEIQMTERMLREVSQSRSALFRAPYGARNAKVKDALAAHSLRSVMWNIDSQDWADPVPSSIADRVVRRVESEKRGIILFHDIQQRTVEALPLVLDALAARGYRFLAWNGSEFVDDATRSAGATASPEDSAAGPAFYRESWAVVVGIDQYQSWPRLHYAVNDARGVRDLLVKRYHFKPENVQLLLDGEATRANILKALGDRLADPSRVQRDDRVFVFFAGHGVTRKLPSGKSLGYLVPVDADRDNYQSQAISMTNFQDVSEAIPAKHVLFVTDACYSGVALTRGGGPGAAGLAYLREVTRRTVRQMLTAGGADQEVADGGPQGHSIFTWALMQGLDGQADLSGDGFITASELAAYVGPTVSSLSRQTPAFGNLVGSEGGEFLFELRHDNEFLSEISDQLDEEAIRLNAELARVRDRIAEKRSRNVKLREELEQAQAQLGGPETSAPAEATA
ncbi:MAG TPA: polysaccharide deacetylase family protein, partial [Vicinamibacteria bacterium]|nr:polysaccharide deacetylase family protein [Vicinamibacteria bacterium]